MGDVPSAWDPVQLWNKALYYAQRAEHVGDHVEDAMLFSCLALELLARAVLTAIHPSLNADPQSEGAHIMFACGIGTPGRPKSIPVHAVFSRLGVAYPEFKAHKSVCELMMNLRNEELHSGINSFSGLTEAKWLSDYYGAVAFLCGKLSKTLEEYLGNDAPHARALIESSRSERRADVEKRVAAQRKLFDTLSAEEESAAIARAVAATKFRSTRTAKCPACDNPALLAGDEIKRGEPAYAERELTVAVTSATSDLKCMACGLHLKTVEECATAGVKPRFTTYEVTSLHEIHEDELEEEYDNM